jgi:hypothetical protein
MTFYLEQTQDPLHGAEVVRLRDETRYVQDTLTDEQLEMLQRLTGYERQQFRAAMLQTLCNKWFKMFGERVEPVAPTSEGETWAVRYVEEVNTCPEELPAKTATSISPTTDTTTRELTASGD